MSEISVNGQRQPLATGATLDDVVTSMIGNADGCAVAVNDSVVPRSDWPARTVEPGDRIEILTAVQGG